MNFKLFLNKNEIEHLNEYLKKSYSFIMLMKIISFLATIIIVFLFPFCCYIFIALFAIFGVNLTNLEVSSIYLKSIPFIIIFIILLAVLYKVQLNKLNDIFKKYNIEDKKTFKSDIIPLYILEFPVLQLSILLSFLNQILFFLYVFTIITCLILSIENIRNGFIEDERRLSEENI